MGSTKVRCGTLERPCLADRFLPGTWVPLRDGKILAERNGVLEKLRPIFDYVPGDSSPPPAPKHTTNSNKPKIPRASNSKKIASEYYWTFSSSALY